MEDGEVLLRRQASALWQLGREFFTELRSQSAAEGGFVVIVEVCGFNDWLLELLQEYGAREIPVASGEAAAAQDRSA